MRLAMDGGDFIRIETVSKRYGATLAVDQLNLSIRRGEFFSLLGPSGCGKTTLLRMIGGFTLPDEGSILLDGEDVTELPPNKRPTNMVFQSYAIFPHLNVRDNIAYGLRSEGVAPAERDARVAEALAMIKLENHGERRAHQLSGGERQRVALARALVKRPKVLLLDEPLGALDKRLREAMQIELRELQREVGISFVFVTHDQEEALSMSDRIAVMEKGRILQIADPKTLYEAPNSRAVAGFIGTMNFFDGRVAAITDGTLRIDTPALGRLEIPLRANAVGSYAPGKPVLVAIRPEKLSLSRDPPKGPSARGRLATAAYLGDRQQFQLVVEGTRAPVAVAAQNATPESGAPFAAGENLHVSWSPEALVLLPPD
jgi:spermidine/putrescine transport system ATP-binding protein/putrescine transport system ATP-binding protein